MVGPHSVCWGHVLRRMWSFRRYKTFLIHNKQVKTSLGTLWGRFIHGMTRYMGTTQYVRFDHFLYMFCNFFLVDDRLGGFLDGKHDLRQAHTCCSKKISAGRASSTITIYGQDPIGGEIVVE